MHCLHGGGGQGATMSSSLPTFGPKDFFGQASQLPSSRHTENMRPSPLPLCLSDPQRIDSPRDPPKMGCMHISERFLPLIVTVAFQMLDIELAWYTLAALIFLCGPEYAQGILLAKKVMPALPESGVPMSS